MYSSVCIHEWSYQFFHLICSLYYQHQKVSLQTVVCCLYILYVHVWIVVTFSLLLSFLPTSEGKFIFVVYTCMDAETSNLFLFLLATLPTSAGEIFMVLCTQNVHECMSKVTIFSPHLLILLPTSGGDFVVLYCFFAWMCRQL